MDFTIRQTATALHLFPKAQNLFVSIGSRQGEVIAVDEGGVLSRLYFDKITYAPFQEALYTAVGKATAARALASGGEDSPIHGGTWIAGSPVVESLAVFQVFATNHANAVVFRRALGHSGSAPRARALECAARCVYPWGCIDLIRNEEVAGANGADWAAYGRKLITSEDAFAGMLSAVLGFFEAGHADGRTPPLLQLRLSSLPERGMASIHTLTLSASVPAVCEAFAADAAPLREALIRKGRGRWADHPLHRYLVAPAASVLDRFVLITCIGDAAVDTHAAAVAACRFAGRRVVTTAAAAAEVGAATPAALVSATPSPLTIRRGEGDDLTGIDADTQLDAMTDAILFSSMTRSASTRHANGSSPAPATSPYAARKAQQGEEGQPQPLTLFGNFAASEKNKEDERATFSVKGPHAVSAAALGRGSAYEREPSSHAQQRASADTHNAPAAAAPSASLHDLADARERVDNEIARWVCEKEQRADAALRAAEKRMDQARQLELDARALLRAVDADTVAQRARMESEKQWLQKDLEELQRRYHETSASLNTAKGHLKQARAEAADIEDEAQERRKRADRSLQDASEHSRAHVDASQRCLDQTKDLCQRYIAHTQQKAALYSRSVTAHQDLFNAASASFHKALLKRFQAHQAALREIALELDRATSELAGTQERVGRSLTDIEMAEQRAHEDMDALATRVQQLRDTEASLQGSVGPLKAQVEALREQVVAAAAAARSSWAEADLAASRARAHYRPEILVRNETAARLELQGDWERASCAAFGAVTAAMQKTAAREQLAHAEAESRAGIMAEAFLFLSSVALRASGTFSTSLSSYVFPDCAAVPAAAAASFAAHTQADIDAMRRAQAQMKAEMDTTFEEVQTVAQLRETLEEEVASVLETLARATEEVMDAESTMLRESERSLSILHYSEAQSAAEYSALIDRCTALIEARSTSRRLSVASSVRGE